MLTAKTVRRKCAKCEHSSTNSVRSFHRFPKPGGKYPDKAREWAKWLYPEKNWDSNEAVLKLYKQGKYTCSAHFRESDFLEHAGRHLRLNAVPSQDATDSDPGHQPPVIRPQSGTGESEMEIPPSDTRSDQQPLLIEPPSGLPEVLLHPPEMEVEITPTDPEPASAPHAAENQGSPTPSTTAPTPKHVSFADGGLPASTPLMTEGQGQTTPTAADSSRHPLRQNRPPRSILTSINVTRAAQLTPRKQVLYKSWKKQAREIRRLKKKAQTNSSSKVIHDLNCSTKIDEMCRNMTPAAITFIKAQIRTAGKKPKGKRWTLDDKLLSLTIYKKSPSAYRFLRKLFSLPSPTTLNHLLTNFPLSPGTSDAVLLCLEKAVAQMKKGEEACILQFDEISLKRGYSHNKKEDIIEGFQDYGEGHGRAAEPVRYALTFQVCGLKTMWKQPIAFYLSANAVTGLKLKELIPEIITKLQNIKLKVLATVCDMGSSNVCAMKHLRAKSSDAFFTVNDQEVAIIYDVPHLLKCTRNMFMKHNVTCTIPAELYDGEEAEGVAKWDHIVELYKLECEKDIYRSCRRLTKAHFNLKFGQKMKVSYAAQVMSHTVGATLLQYASSNKIPDSVASAAFAMEVDNLFDSLNGSTDGPEDGKPLKCKISRFSRHHSYWAQQKKKIRAWKYADSNPPSQDGWIRTINGVLHVWKAVKKLGFSTLTPRRLNQDPLENLFGVIRALCGGNSTPTVPQFIGALKTAIINGIAIHDAKRMNCESDDNEYLSNLRTLLTASGYVSDSESDSDSEDGSSASSTDEPEDDAYTALCTEMREKLRKKCDEMKRKLHNASPDSLSVASVAGFIAGRMLESNDKCEACRTLLTTEADEIFNELIYFKEREESERLTRPSFEMATAVGSCATVVDEFLKKHAHLPHVKASILAAMKNDINFSWLRACEEHFDFNKTAIEESTFAIWTNWWLTRENRAFVEKKKSQSAKKKEIKKLKKMSHA